VTDRARGGLLAPARDAGPDARPLSVLGGWASRLVGTLLLVTAASREALADSESAATRAPQTVASATSHRVRLALSAAAERRLGAVRLRRLLSIELGRRATLEREATGPLGDELVLMWVDMSEDRVNLQVRRTGRNLARHELDITGLRADLAAHVIAIEASEMIRVQLGASPPDPCVSCALASAKAPRPLDALSFGASAALRTFQGGRTDWLAGPRLELSHDGSKFRHGVRVEWLGGEGDDGRARWLAVGVGAAARLPLPERFSVAVATLGADLAIASLASGTPSPSEAWITVASARLGLDVRVARRTWLGLRLEPGLAVAARDDLDPVFTFGAALGISAGPSR